MRVLTTSRLLLRPFHVLDAPALESVLGDAEVMRFGDGPQDATQIQDWLRNCRTQYAEWGFGVYAVVERDSRAVIGYCGLTYFPDLAGRAEVELGYRLARRAWGNGYATEAARAVRGEAFDLLGLRRLTALIDPANTASARVAEKLGMRYEKDVMLPGYTHPDHLYVVES